MRRSAARADPFAILAAVALCVVALWPQGDGRAEAAPELALTASGGAELWNSKAGEPLFGSSRWRPGQRIGGMVRIENRSNRPVEVRLSAEDFEESWAVLSDRTRIRVQRVGIKLRPEQRRIVFGGRLKELDDARIARNLKPDRSRRYRVRVRLLPRAGNKYQRASLTFALRWRSYAR